MRAEARNDARSRTTGPSMDADATNGATLAVPETRRRLPVREVTSSTDEIWPP